MKLRLRFSTWSMISLALGGFAACSFGADDFKIVPGTPSNGGDGSGDTTSSAGDNPGGNSTSGSSTGGKGQGGTTGATGGETPVGGEGGAGGAGGPHFLCSPQANTFTVLSQPDHQLRNIDGLELAASPTGVVAIASGISMAGVANSRVVFRSLTDSNGGMPDAMGFVETPGMRIQVAAATVTQKHELRFMGVDDAGLFEYATPMPLNGNGFQPPMRRDLNGAQICPTLNNGHLREVHGDYGPPGLGFAFTCADPTDTSFQLYLSSADMPGMVPEPIKGNTDINSIVKRYIRTADSHFMFVGNDVAPTIGVRYGADVQALSTVHTMGLSDDPKVWSSLNAVRFPTGMLLTGAAFTTNGTPNNPPIVPADIYAGIIDNAGIDTLFKATPPTNLQHVTTFTKASQAVGFEDAMPLGDNVLGVGIHLTDKGRASAMMISPNGDILAGPTEIYASTSNGLIKDHSLHIAPLGLGAIMVWAEGNEVKARMFSCLPD